MSFDLVNSTPESGHTITPHSSLVYQEKNFYAVDYSHAEKALLAQIEWPPITACAN